MKFGICTMGLLTFSALLTSCTKSERSPYFPPPGVSWSSILTRSADLSTIAETVQPWERSIHFSSSATTGKVLLASLAPEITGDMDHGFFIDVVETSSGVDATLAEVRGKGMITWIWSANPAGTVRLFIDNENTPALEMPFKDFLNGSFLPVAYPFAALTANGYNLHFPFLHEGYCKVVLRMESKKALASLYYQIAWNALDPAQDVARFAVPDITAGKDLLRSIADKQLHPFTDRPDSELQQVEIAADQTFDMYSSQQPGTITRIDFHTQARDELAHLDLLAYWDNATTPSIDCPLYMFLGTSERVEDRRSQIVQVRGGSAAVRWPMPFNAARLAIKNTSGKAIRLDYTVDLKPESKGLRFGGQHRIYNGLRTDAPNVITLSDMYGPGRIVACNIQVKSRTTQWWGEGDQLIYLDSDEIPTWQGTGTEDYFGFAWCSQSTFHHPLRGQTAVWKDGTQRTSAMFRDHILDQLPFHSFAVFQTEAWGLADGYMDYESVILYYTTSEAQQAVGENGEPAPAFGGHPKTTLPAEPAGELDSPSDAVSQP